MRETESTSTNDVENIEVHEFYSVPRIAPRPIGRYVKKSMSFDINTNDESGDPWNSMSAKQGQKARKHVIKHKTLFIIGSPPCDQWSIMQNLNNGKRNREEVQRKMIEARIHLEFCAQLYLMQIKEGRYYLHEHPTSASSWNERCMQDILKHHGNIVTIIHMCAYKMRIPDAQGNEYIYKPAQFSVTLP